MLSCKMIGCNGTLDESHPICVQTGCMSVTPAYQCSNCHRLHFYMGDLVFSRAGHPVYVDDQGYYFNSEETHLLVHEFPTENYKKRRVNKKATCVGEIRTKADLQLPMLAGKWLLCWNPKTNRWIELNNVRELLK